MLELRPNCEWCDKDLPPDAVDAHICSYECTYCTDCVETILQNVCPTCGGGFAPRPIRPANAYHQTPQLGLDNQPASTNRVHSRWSEKQVAAMVARLKHLPPTDR
jgi:hypothetical protein